MSWEDWCKTIKGLGFEAGGIYGLDSSVWAEFGQDTQFKFSRTDIPAVLEKMKVGLAVESSPVHVNGMKQTLLSAEDGQLVGKRGRDSTLVAIKCNQCVMVGVGGANSEPRHLLQPLAQVAESLKSSGY